MKSITIKDVLQPAIMLRDALDRVIDLMLREEFDTTFSQFKVLVALDCHGLMMQKEIASFWGVSEPSINRQVSILQKVGLIKRSVDENDARRFKIELTPSGRDLLKKAFARLDVVMEELFYDIDDKERVQFIALTEKFNNCLKIGRPDLLDVLPK